MKVMRMTTGLLCRAIKGAGKPCWEDETEPWLSPKASLTLIMYKPTTTANHTSRSALSVDHLSKFSHY